MRMTEAEYQYECGRAELLGLPKPGREEFFSRQREAAVKDNPEEAEMTAEQTQDASVREEGFRRIGGGLDELNSILSSTQKKLNRFKNVCGSFSNILKLHIVAKKEEENDNSVDSSTKEGDPEVKSGENQSTISESPPVQSNKVGDSQLDKLDSLINKAERAELSLNSQNKQMKKFLH